MPRPKSILYSQQYYIRSIVPVDSNGVQSQIETVHCNVNSCTAVWSMTLPKYTGTSSLKSHLRTHHPEQWLAYSDAVLKESSNAVSSSSSSSSSVQSVASMSNGVS
jgi:hypothetical protein